MKSGVDDDEFGRSVDDKDVLDPKLLSERTSSDGFSTGGINAPANIMPDDSSEYSDAAEDEDPLSVGDVRALSISDRGY